MKWLHPLRRVPANEVQAEQLFEAERLYAEHIASAEHHAALAGMYKARLERIRKEQAGATELRAVK